MLFCCCFVPPPPQINAKSQSETACCLRRSDNKKQRTWGEISSLLWQPTHFRLERKRRETHTRTHTPHFNLFSDNKQKEKLTACACACQAACFLTAAHASISILRKSCRVTFKMTPTRNIDSIPMHGEGETWLCKKSWIAKIKVGFCPVTLYTWWHILMLHIMYAFRFWLIALRVCVCERVCVWLTCCVFGLTPPDWYIGIINNWAVVPDLSMYYYILYTSVHTRVVPVVVYFCLRSFVCVCVRTSVICCGGYFSVLFCYVLFWGCLKKKKLMAQCVRISYGGAWPYIFVYCMSYFSYVLWMKYFRCSNRVVNMMTSW